MSERPESSRARRAECIGDVFRRRLRLRQHGKLHADFPTKNKPQHPGTYVSDAVPEWATAAARTPPRVQLLVPPTAPTTCTSIPITGIPTATVTMSTSGRRGTKFPKAIEYIENKGGVRDPEKNRS